MKICLMCRKRNIEYYGICSSCKEINDTMRERSCDLTGKWAVVTGGRIKIGYAVCLRLLRAGANVIAVTRYPKTALENYSRETDFSLFRDRLYIIGFDLLRVDLISELIDDIADISGGKIDILINNAAQTVKKSNEYYSRLQSHENQQINPLYKTVFHENQLLLENSVSPFLLSKTNCTENSLISFGTLSDYGETGTDNSWVRKPENISAKEMLEVQLINVTAPFLLTNGLRYYMQKSSSLNKFIINVSSVEGRFNTRQKLARHVHTNMAKASLNMMTHSIAADFAKDRIFVYSCDPGWVSNQFPPEYEISRNFTPYLTFEDGAARLLYPIVKNMNENLIRDYGSFYKDYEVIDY